LSKTTCCRSQDQTLSKLKQMYEIWGPGPHDRYGHEATDLTWAAHCSPPPPYEDGCLKMARQLHYNNNPPLWNLTYFLTFYTTKNDNNN